ncbi:uncharacterized protein LOC134178613 [Corticium candelabrum]|uniref:uncharacterized protein LOC134178613 n=1 Tax=Corticium candelabrum TaxID=121492 RepID=UPI002E267ECB|nr:uncharacterized protein LOC134178613 [Corticium candelabrum]
MAGKSELERRREERKGEKRDATLYLNERSTQQQLELLLNKAVRLKPDDLFGYLTRELSCLALPVTVYQVTGSRIIDLGGETAVKVTVHCTINGVSEVMQSAICSFPLPVVVTPVARSQSSLSRNSKQNSVTEDPVQPDVSANSLNTVEEIVTKSSELLKNKKIAELESLDTCLKSLDVSLPDEVTVCMCASWTISLALAKSACDLLHKPLYELLFAMNGVENETVCPPVVVARMLSGGTVSNGKLKIRDFSVIPAETDYEEGIRNVCKFHKALGSVLSVKYGPSALAVLADGSYAPSLDKPEQAFDLLQEAMTMSQLEWKTHLLLAVNINASCGYDPEKNRYELTSGQWKTRDDLLTYYTDLKEQRPELVSLENPFTDQDSGSWCKLSERLGEGFTLIGETGRPEASDEDKPEQDIQSVESLSAMVDKITWNSQSTITQLCQTSRTIMSGTRQLLLNCDSNVNSDCVADVAMGVQTKYLKLPAPSSFDFLGIYNRLVQIYHHLKSRDNKSDSRS